MIMQPQPTPAALRASKWPCIASAKEKTRLTEVLRTQIGPVIFFEETSCPVNCHQRGCWCDATIHVTRTSNLGHTREGHVHVRSVSYEVSGQAAA
jgi:hypothetical protein